MGRWPAAVAVLLVACGDNRAAIVDAGAPPDAAIDAREPVYEGPPPEQDVVRGGTRLRARFLGDGARVRQHRGMYDTVLAQECRWGWADGWRCMPEHEADDLYEDAACLHPVATQELACPSRYLHVFDRSREPWSLRAMYELEAEFRPAAPLWRPENGTCREVTPQRYRRTVRRVELGELARGYQVRAGDGRVQTETIVGVDGSWSPWPIAYDRALGVRCTPRPELGVCEPEAANTATYADAACSRPVLIVAAGTPAPAYLRARTLLTEADVIYARGAVLGPDNPAVDLHDLEGGTCTARTAPVPLGASLFAAGPAVPLDAMPTARLVSSGTAPLDEVRLVAGELDQHHHVRDAARGTECDLAEDVRGGWRCLPEGLPRVRSYFQGIDCSSTIDLIDGVDDVNEDTVAVRWSVTSCGRAAAAEAVGARYPFWLWVGVPHHCYAIFPVVYQPAGPATFDAYPALEEWIE